MVAFGLAWTDPLSLTCSRLGLLVLTWTHVDLFGLTPSYIVPHLVSWSQRLTRETGKRSEVESEKGKHDRRQSALEMIRQRGHAGGTRFLASWSPQPQTPISITIHFVRFAIMGPICVTHCCAFFRLGFD
jgi:hypothetical protein